MKYGLLLLALCIAATALTSGALSATPTTINLNKLNQNSSTTTPSPNTTTHSPNTTTHSPNTTTHSPNTTTSAPSTTTTPLPVPTPSTNMTVGNYNVTDEKGSLCIMLDMAIGIRVNTSMVNGTFIVQPSKTNFNGECSQNVASIILNFGEGGISLKFNKNDATKKVFVEFIQYDLTYAFKTGVLSNYTGLNRSLELFSVDLGHSYSCKAETVYMGGGVSLDLTQNRFQAFDIKNNVFGSPEVCKADQRDYRVAIVVGIILIILIVIVVIAYLISRKRRSNGYQSL
ncbi:macrosialin-like [Sinocyclocheilus grahami]|uniref:macrosialin-like n=1 Tax=Sinocyclocheilus grahami TaxID=75366 RepID=UPI0007AD5CA1|nr:PREDICTED: macrosialin-like [Sinocyclocheilus grahami]